MSVDIDVDKKAAMYAPATDEVFLVLLTVRHDDLADAIRLTSDSVPTVRADGTYQPFPFEITLPSPNDDEVGATLSIDIVDRQVLTALQSVETAPTLDIEVIAASDAENPIVRYPDLIWDASSFNGLTLTGQLRLDDLGDEPLAGTFSPSTFQALFRG